MCVKSGVFLFRRALQDVRGALRDEGHAEHQEVWAGTGDGRARARTRRKPGRRERTRSRRRGPEEKPCQRPEGQYLEAEGPDGADEAAGKAQNPLKEPTLGQKIREAVTAAAHATSGGRLKPRPVPRGSVKEMLSTRVTTKNDRLRKRRHAEWRLDATIAFDILHRAG